MDFSEILQRLKEIGAFNKEPQIEQSAPSTVDEALGIDPREEFKRRISGVESNFGTNLNHPLIQSGIQAGDKAIGQYALMPNTIQEFAGRMGNKKLKDMPKELYPDYFKKNPKEYDEMADYGMDFVLDKFKDPEAAAFAWNQGHNLDPNTITPEKLEKSDYIRKFRNIKDRIK